MKNVYETVKAEFGVGPDYPSRDAHTTYFGYKAGAVVGSFPSMTAAKEAGATTTEKAFDREGFEEKRNAYQAHHKAIVDAWYDRVRAQYPDVNDKLFGIIYSEAYDRGHSYGYGEVESYIDDGVDFAKRIIAASKE